MRSIELRTGVVAIAAVALLGVAAGLRAADNEIVVVDQGELSAYWRGDQTQNQMLELTVDGPEIYGCMAVPFVIDPAGRMSPGRMPLLARIGQSPASGAPDIDALYTFTMGALPAFTATWDKPLSDSIYSSHAVVLGDKRIRARLGDEKWADLRVVLERQCRIEGLAAWLETNKDKAAVQSLPARPEQLLASPR